MRMACLGVRYAKMGDFDCGTGPIVTAVLCRLDCRGICHRLVSYQYVPRTEI
ncbi:hypothetical protein PhaeoP97_03115 [Phaeobacter porticola]|uniref:Uncharacterized protein n=1 Tax=Phaeobacter porticola TaxID=1844006 RepID=A0A1L3I8Q1_9RHOB|nr:hypothetical protein PhaeoP97_03115 [Phaeobacter porticola]